MSGALCLMIGASGSLLLSTNAVSFYGSIVGTGTATTSPNCVITVSGGSGNYSFSWVRLSGTTSINISNASASTVNWNRTFGLVASFDNTWQCTVTDNVTGRIASTAIITATLERTA